MGVYINRGNEGFRQYTNGEYVDKTGLIAYVNTLVDTADKLVCVSRPRRFGKSLTAQMLYAYYDKSCDSRELFGSFSIAGATSYERHINHYSAIYLDITEFTTRNSEGSDILGQMQKRIIKDVSRSFPMLEIDDDDDLMDVLVRLVAMTGEKLVMIIDEWDAMCREAINQPQLMNDYVNFLRRLFKGGDTSKVFALVYMTGILPIKKYGTQSALNDFREYSMTDPGPMAEYFGFVPAEVQALCEKHGMDFDEMRRWYDGYHFCVMRPLGVANPQPVEVSVFNPNSVMQAVGRHLCNDYWGKTEAFDSLQRYIDMDFSGVSESLERLLKGEELRISTIRFGNDLYDVQSDDELFTLLVHLGYVSFRSMDNTISIPNLEVRKEFTEAVRGSKSHLELSRWVRASDQLLEATWRMDADAVAKGIDNVHNMRIAPLHYHNEHALCTVIRMAYIGAVDYYTEFQELPSGKGFADIVLIPRYGLRKPALLIELKWNHSVESAIEQIRHRNYPQQVASLSGSLLLIGISYDEKTKVHTCKIEDFQIE